MFALVPLKKFFFASQSDNTSIKTQHEQCEDVNFKDWKIDEKYSRL